MTSPNGAHSLHPFPDGWYLITPGAQLGACIQKTWMGTCTATGSCSTTGRGSRDSGRRPVSRQAAGAAAAGCRNVPRAGPAGGPRRSCRRRTLPSPAPRWRA